MLKRLTQKKEYLFFAGIVLLVMIGYQLAFKRTLEVWLLNQKLKEQMASSADVSYQPEYQKRKNANLDKIIGHYRADTLNFRTNGISIISVIAEKNNVRLSEVPVQDHTFSNEKFMVQMLTFEGDFFSLTKTLESLQNTANIGAVRSVVYRLGKREEHKLLIEVYLVILR